MILEPPHNDEAEQAVLGAIMISVEAYHRVSGFLKAEHFHEPIHGTIYAEAARLIDGGRRATPISLKTRFGAEQYGGLTIPQYLGRLAAASPGITDAYDYGRAVYDLAVRRRLVEVGEKLARDAAQAGIEAAPDAMIEAAEVGLAALAERGVAGSNTLTAMDAATEALGAVAAAFQRGGDTIGLPTGLRDLDKKTGGLVPGELIVVAGRPSMGKSALAVRVAYHNGRRMHDPALGCPVGFFSLEMSASQHVLRLIAQESGVSASALRRGNLNHEQLNNVAAVTEERIAPARLHFDQSGGLSIAQLCSRARRMWLKHKIGLLVVDYLQLLSGSGKHRGNQASEVGEISGSLKALAKELEVPVLAVSQLSRQVESREDKRPVLSDLRESGAIEQDADVVMFIFREEYYLARGEPKANSAAHDEWARKIDKARDKAEIIIAKQRQGPIGTVEARFDAKLTQFSDLAKTEQLPWSGYE